MRRCRAALCERYRIELEGWAGQRGVGLPQIPAHCEPPPHIFYLILPTPEARRALCAGLTEVERTTLIEAMRGFEP